MAIDRNAAMDTVASNFGLTREDLGVSDNDGDGLAGFEDLDEEGEGDTGGDPNDGFDGQGDTGADDPDMGEGERPARRARDQFGREPQPKRSQQQQQPQRQQQQERFPASAYVQPNARGDLVDSRSGQVVARAGREARLYQHAVNTTRQLTAAGTQLQALRTDLTSRLTKAVDIGRDLYTRIEKYQAQEKQIKDLGVSPQEQLEALQIVAMGKTNPIGAIKMLLTRAAAAGIDLTQLGLQGGGDMASLATMLRQEIKQNMQPLHERTEAEKRQEEQRRQQEQGVTEARTHVNNFFARNPDAKQFLPVIDAVLQQHPEHSLDEVWARIQLGVERNARLRGRQNPRQFRGAPSGRPRMPSAAKSRMAPVNQSYEAIARDVLEGAGIR